MFWCIWLRCQSVSEAVRRPNSRVTFIRSLSLPVSEPAWGETRQRANQRVNHAGQISAPPTSPQESQPVHQYTDQSFSLSAYKHRRQQARSTGDRGMSVLRCEEVFTLVLLKLSFRSCVFSRILFPSLCFLTPKAWSHSLESHHTSDIRHFYRHCGRSYSKGGHVARINMTATKITVHYWSMTHHKHKHVQTHPRCKQQHVWQLRLNQNSNLNLGQKLIYQHKFDSTEAQKVSCPDNFKASINLFQLHPHFLTSYILCSNCTPYRTSHI